MKIRLTKESLLRQLPDGDLPEFVILDGLPCNPTGDVQVQKFPRIAEVLSRTQWQMFAEMERMGECTYVELSKYVRKGDPVSMKNLVAQHIVYMRRKFKQYHIPYRIKGLRFTYRDETTYQLIALDDLSTMRHNT